MSWAFVRVGVHCLSLCLPYSGVIPSTFLHLPLDFIRVSSLAYGRRICTHSVDPSLTRFLSEFPGLGLSLVGLPDVVVPEAEFNQTHIQPIFGLCRGTFPVLSINSSRVSSLAEPGLGAHLSSYPEGTI